MKRNNFIPAFFCFLIAVCMCVSCEKESLNAENVPNRSVAEQDETDPAKEEDPVDGDTIFNDRIIVDWVPVSMYITVLDVEGNDLLDPSNANNLVEGTTAVFRGQTYEVRTNCVDKYGTISPYQASTRACAATWRGLCLIDRMRVWDGQKNVCEKTEHYMLYIGELNGASDLDEDITLTLGNGEQHLIHYHCSDHKVSKDDISCNRWYSIDGVKSDSNMLKIVVE